VPPRGRTACRSSTKIARKDEDAIIEAEFDPESGTVTVYAGRREFRELERPARRAGYPNKRAAEYTHIGRRVGLRSSIGPSAARTASAPAVVR
jgi:hypothetical protein